MNDPEPVARLHELTKHGSATHDRSALVDFRPLDPTNRPSPFKRYRGLSARPLPTELGATGAVATDVLAGRHRRSPVPVDASVLARLLFFSAGVTRSASSGGGEPTFFRAAMSAGNLHPVEIYVVSGDLSGVPAGVNHFAPLEFGLTTLRSGEWRPALAAAAAEPAVALAPCTFVLTGIPWRTAWKYGERGYRHLFWDAGSIVANLLAVAEAHGLSARVLVGFVDAAVGRLIGVDAVSEFPLALVVVGAGDGSGPAPPEPEPERVEPLEAELAPISPHPIVFPLVTEAQRAGELGDPGAVAAWRPARGAETQTPPPMDVPEVAGNPSIEEIILRRGSTRVMRRAECSGQLLRWGMAVASRPLPGDFVAVGGSLLEHWLSVHAVTGVEAGAYRWGGGRLETGRRGDFRATTQELCLNQPLGGDSAYTAFHCTNLEGVLGALGSRGYRAAQLEAGVAAGRLAVAAFTLGYGASGLTFFDDPVSRFFATPDACMLVSSVGEPAYRNRPGGMPGAAAELRGFGRLQLHRAEH